MVAFGYKARLVTGGYLEDVPATVTCESVLSRKTFQIVFKIEHIIRSILIYVSRPELES